MKQNQSYKKAVYFFILLATGLALVALTFKDSQRALSPSDYLKFTAQKKGSLLVEASSSHAIYSLQYLPTQYQIAREIQRNANANIEELRTKYEGHHYFDLIIKMKDKRGISEHLKQVLGIPKTGDYMGEQQLNKVLNDLSFHAKDNFSLVIGRDTQDCVLYHLERERMAGLGMRYALVFQDGLTEEKVLQLHYKNEFIEPQGIVLELSGEAIRQLPKLKL